MNAPLPVSPSNRRGPSTLKLVFWLLVVPIVLGALYFALVLNWNYSDGERAGYIQKFSRKGWLCKTWEGELALVTMPGAIPEKFLFTVWDDATANSINKVMGKRVTLHYEEKVGLPTSCFGETRHFVNRVVGVDEIPLMPGVVVPTPPATAPPVAPSAAQIPTPPVNTAPAPSMTPAPTPPPPATK